MLNQKTIGKHERNNAAVAAHVLRNRATQPYALVVWAETCQRRQRRERAERAATVTTTTTATAARKRQQRSLAKAATPQQQQPLVSGVLHGAA